MKRCDEAVEQCDDVMKRYDDAMERCDETSQLDLRPGLMSAQRSHLTSCWTMNCFITAT